jgi:uncharacterized membrane protein HdeD (DUF308 family)
MSDRESGPWWGFVVVGLLSAAAGIAMIVWPDITLTALALISGINILLLSGLLIAATLFGAEQGDRTLRVVVGVLGVIAGLIVIKHPQQALLVVVLAVGIWLVLSGLAEAMGALAIGGERRWLRVAGGAIEIAIGILVLALPKVSLGTLAVLIGIGFIIRGIALVLAGWLLHRAGAGETPPTPLEPRPA